jgi:hypothetical protein
MYVYFNGGEGNDAILGDGDLTLLLVAKIMTLLLVDMNQIS